MLNKLRTRFRHFTMIKFGNKLLFNTLQNGRRAKLETADGNEIDTMFMDKRSPSKNIEGNGENLVMFYLNNSTACSFSAVREDRHFNHKI